MLVVGTGRLQPPAFIINFPTKGHCKSRSRLADIDSGLRDLRRVLQELEIASVAVPPLGCGLGGLSWSDVRPRIEDALADLPSRVLVHEPQGAPAP
jgi:O-acetyl-ADP-ribose deacetylase (regulator of RNase III)